MSKITATNSTTNPQNSPPIIPSSEFDTLKSILEVYRTIFDTHCITQRLPVITRIEQSPSFTKSKEPMVYVIHQGPRQATGDACFPRTLATHEPDLARAKDLQDAYLKLNSCDFALESMIESINSKLQGFGAKAEWLLVHARAKFLLKYSENDTTPWHSVFGITSANGAQFIADFTIEQFGHSRHSWFLTQSDYLDKYTENGERKVAPVEHQADNQQDEVELECLLEVTLLCDELDWSALEGLGREAKVSMVAGWALDAFQRDEELEELDIEAIQTDEETDLVMFFDDLQISDNEANNEESHNEIDQ